MNSLLAKIRFYGLKTSLLFFFHEVVRFVWLQKIKKSFSQSGEDLVIDEALAYKRKGFYVDVGAYDPHIFSNTKRFYLKGWKGINVEADGNRFKRFLLQRKRDINLNIGIDSRKGDITFFHFFPETLSTFSKKAAEIYVKEGFTVLDKKIIPVKKLSTILEKYCKNKHIDFLSVDTEGTDLDVLQSNNWKVFRPKVVCVESTIPSGKYSKPDKSIGRFLNSVGYTKFRDVANNSIYIDSQK